MARVTDPPREWESDGPRPAGWWRSEDSDTVLCELCPRGCRIASGKRGYCHVRENRDGRLICATYGRSTGFCIDPIEKKPLHHFHPGTPILSFGTAGCNLGCKCCQNWTSVRNEQVDAASDLALPNAIVAACIHHEVPAVAYTYNEPTVWAEYAIDTARVCRAAGLRNVAVTNGYVNPEPRKAFYECMDAANVDLKGFNEAFYQQHTGGRLKDVQETLLYLVRETDVWVEITNLVIPGMNDAPDEIERMCDWIVDELGPDTPLHFSAFHPDFQMRGLPRTPAQTLFSAHDTAQRAGLNYVYVGNINDPDRQATRCPSCSEVLIRRVGYELPVYRLDDGHCRYCGAPIAGRFDARPGAWGSRRQPVQIAAFAETTPAAPSTPPPEIAAPKKETPTVMSETMTNAKRPSSADAPLLTPEQESEVFQAAGRRVARAVLRGPAESLAETLGAVGRTPLIGAFVSLKRSGQLRSCCGTLSLSLPLHEALDGAAMRAATDDPRFPPISPSELSHLDMEVWLLWNMQVSEAQGEERLRAFEIGRHGLQISRGGNRGLLLPGVAIEHKMDAKAFLEAVCRKAGLPLSAWMEETTVLQTFEGYAVSGPFSSVELQRESDESHPSSGPSLNDLDRLRGFCRQNFLAMIQGATPSYFMAGLYDGAVAGMILRVRFAQLDETIDATKIGTRADLPVQATLYELVQSAVASAANRRIPPVVAMTADLSLTVLSDVAMHGAVRSPALDGVDPRRRALMAAADGRWSLGYSPESSPENLLDDVVARLKLRESADASLLSYGVATTEPTLKLSNIPKPLPGPKVRRPAVAGQFYPATADEIDQSLDEMIPKNREPKPCGAVVAPHAGWTYSGKLAAETLASVEIPETAIVFCPRHRRMGAEWAVAPHETWQLPGRSVASDPELAAALADAVDGWELDAAAHAQEHAIEVLLPILHRLSPKTKVVGVTIGRASLADLKGFGKQLAAVLEKTSPRPLLIVSSDMNHFENLEHTQRVDRLALDAIETLDPDKLFETVETNRISMCGMMPCVLVMETLKRLHALDRCESVGYTTSAEASGDKNRVVGYAGLVLA